ncbi:MAG: hypothetical protein WDN66_02740 [Candidatus Saccharibacteria bacterium]
MSLPEWQPEQLEADLVSALSGLSEPEPFEQAIVLPKLKSWDNVDDTFGQQYRAFFTMFDQARSQEFEGRRLVGPTYEPIREILAEADEQLKEINPSLNPSVLFDPGYQPLDTFRSYADLSRPQRDQIERIVRLRARELRSLGIDLATDEQETVLEDGLLEHPELRYQGEHESVGFGKNCFNACYRMVLNGLVDFTPNEIASVRASTKIHRTIPIPDDEYLKTFYTPKFSEISERHVDVISINGGSLSTIGNIARKVGNKNPDATVSCIVNLQSESATNIWHTNVLTGCDEKMIYCLDPRAYAGHRYDRHVNTPRAIPKFEFYTRWTVAYNRAHLIVAQ